VLPVEVIQEWMGLVGEMEQDGEDKRQIGPTRGKEKLCFHLELLPINTMLTFPMERYLREWPRGVIEKNRVEVERVPEEYDGMVLIHDTHAFVSHEAEVGPKALSSPSGLVPADVDWRLTPPHA
jgi:hypothetical protein